MTSLNPAKPWGTKDYFSGIGYYTHHLESYVLKAESLVIPSRPPPAERSAEDKPFYLVPRRPDDPRVRANLTSGSFSLNAFQSLPLPWTT